jgi:hypothetical protein
MKLRILSCLVAVAVPACMTNCATTKTVRVLEDGTKVENSTYGLTDRAGSFADAYARYRLRMPLQPVPAK